MNQAPGQQEGFATSWQELDLREKGDWAFVGGEWGESEEGLISPPQPVGQPLHGRPEVVVDENLAVYRRTAFGDFEAEFDFRWESFCCGGGFLFRARDAGHYYLVEFPCTAQQYRTEYFWACISKVDESGWTKVLHTELMHGVPTEVGTWHHCRLLVQGNEIRLWVGGRPFSVVHDDTYSEPGYVGLESYSELGAAPSCGFRNVRIRGQQDSAAHWDESIEPVKNWFYPTVENTYGEVHHLSSIARAPNGDLLMKLKCGDVFHGEEYTPVLIRSADNGRTWSAMERLPDRLLKGTMFAMRDGRLWMTHVPVEHPHPILIAESQDNGQTWSEYEQCGTLGFYEEADQAHIMSLQELSNGDLIWFIYTHSTNPELDYPSAAYCIRSTDGGRNWSAPVSLDGPRPEGFEQFNLDHMQIKRFGDEVSAAETQHGKIVAFVRPNYEPVMWETWSEDKGRTWTPASRGPFGMWACDSSMLCTASGALLIAGRHPGLAFQLSYDDGMTWECVRFDTTFWANGFTCEIEPDLVMYASTGKYGDPRVRIHLIRITPQGPEPVRWH